MGMAIFDVKLPLSIKILVKSREVVEVGAKLPNICKKKNSLLAKPNLMKAAALWADAFYKSKCLSVCGLSVC